MGKMNTGEATKKDIIGYTIAVLLVTPIMIFYIRDAPAPWKDPLGFIWFIMSQPEPGPWSGIFMPYIFWLMFFLGLPLIMWFSYTYAYIKGKDPISVALPYFGIYFIIYIEIILLAFLAQRYAYYGFSWILAVVGIIVISIAVLFLLFCYSLFKEIKENRGVRNE